MAKEGAAVNQTAEQERLRQLALGYIPAALIGVVTELGIPDLLSGGPKPISELAAATNANEDALYRMLRTLASFGIFTESAGRHFALTSTGTHLRSDVPNSLRGFIRWMTNPFILRNYAGLMHPAKTGQPAVQKIFGKAVFAHLQSDPELSRTFNEGMTAISQFVSGAVLQAYDFSGIKVLADIAGGEGALLAAILQKHPAMQGLLVEQEHVTVGARKRLEASGLAHRCQCLAVDFFQSVPAGADAYLMKSIIHDWDDERARVILKNCREALRGVDRGKLLLVEPVIQPGNEPQVAKLIDIQMLVMTGGRERTRDEFQALLESSGFRMTAVIPTPSFVCVVEALPQ